jgi:uncharacterized protein YyaL (SSP411 family)
MLAAFGYSLAPPKQIVIAGETEREDTRAMLRAVRRRFLPYKIVLFTDSDGKATAHVCENQVCSLPVNDPAELERLLA